MSKVALIGLSVIGPWTVNVWFVPHCGHQLSEAWMSPWGHKQT
jgi:hypothetical protein